MKIGKLALGLGVSALLTGCVSSKLDYHQPMATKPVEKTIVLNMSANETWEKVVPALASSFFVVNNIDKESGFINLSYSGTPQKYVDCGYIESMVNNLAGKRTYYFPAASSYEAYETFENGHLFQIYRKLNLDGRINLIVQDIGKNKSSLTVNTKYLLQLSGNWKNASGAGASMDMTTISFNTNGEATFPSGTKCKSLGTLEREILDLVNQK